MYFIYIIGLTPIVPLETRNIYAYMHMYLALDSWDRLQQTPATQDWKEAGIENGWMDIYVFLCWKITKVLGYSRDIYGSITQFNSELRTMEAFKYSKFIVRFSKSITPDP